MKKRFFVIILSVFILISVCSVFTSCKGNDKNGKFSVVTTIFPEYDWVMNVLGEEKDQVDVTLLLDNGVDLHSYQPTVDDIVTIAGCDLFIYVGGESDSWVKDVMKNAKNENMIVLDLMEILGDKVKEEELVEGMEGEEDEEGEEEEGPEYDEHVWLSLNNAEIIIPEIASALGRIDEEKADEYAENSRKYCEQIDALEKEYATAVSEANAKTLLFGDRFPFRYMTEDYGLTYYAAFIGCSAETEASFETVAFLAEKADELGLKVILKLESSDGRIADTVRSNMKSSGVRILTMDSLQSATKKEYKNGRNYLSVMRENLGVLKQALA